jgi:hypothetical protein
MLVRTKMIAAGAAVTAALAAGGGAALAFGGSAAATPIAAARTDALVETLSAIAKPGLQADAPSFNAVVAAVASRLHVSTVKVSAALRSLFGTGGDPLAPSFAAAARSLGVSTQQLSDALAYAKQNLAPFGQARQNIAAGPRGKFGPAGTGHAVPAERAVHTMFVASVARELHVSTARVSAALAPMFAVGQANSSSASFAVAARSLGASVQQLQAAIMQAKQSLAPRS